MHSVQLDATVESIKRDVSLKIWDVVMRVGELESILSVGISNRVNRTFGSGHQLLCLLSDVPLGVFALEWTIVYCFAGRNHGSPWESSLKEISGHGKRFVPFFLSPHSRSQLTPFFPNRREQLVAQSCSSDAFDGRQRR